MALLINAFSGFEMEVFLITLMIAIEPGLLLSGLIYWYQQHRKKIEINKILIQTVIAEVMTITVKPGKSTYSRLYYRLGDGSLVYLSGSPLKAGNTVEIKFLQGKDGSRGQLLEKQKL